MILANLGGIIIFSIALVVMLIVVPVKQIKELLLIGFIGGFGVALLLNHMMQNVFGFWIYKSVDFLYLSKIPVFLSLGWIPCIITYSYLITKYQSLSRRLIFLNLFPLGGLLIHYLLIANGMMVYHNWNLIWTFLLSVTIHSILLAYLYLTRQMNNVQKLT